MGILSPLIVISSLSLTNFRSYAAVNLEVPETPLVFLVGPNGAGKTNLLEALSLLGGGRGLRRAPVHDLTKIGSAGDPAWVINAELSKPPLRHKISQALTAEGRLTRLDQKTTTGTHLGRLIPTVCLTPVEDSLFRGPPEDRRALLDRFVMAMYPDHRTQLSAYNKSLRERNALLRQALRDGTPPNAAWLTGLEQLMATHGVALAHQRRVYLASLASAVAQGLGPFPAAALGLQGEMEADLQDQEAGDVELNWATRWQRERGADLSAGRTLHGPHRTDLSVMFRAKHMPAAQCSTGEQKALLLSLFLGQARLLNAAHIRPLLLLDEVAAHLDADRRATLMEELAGLGAQTWITGTDRQALMAQKIEDKSTVFTLQNASVALSNSMIYPSIRL